MYTDSWKKYTGLAAVAVGGGIVFLTRMRQKICRENGWHVPYGPYEAFLKRPFDIVMGGVTLVLAGPLLALTAWLVKIRLGTPVMFVQERPGLHGCLFRIYKFRTMTQQQGKDGKLLPDEDRLDSFGKKLRSSSLDELPELINILKGDMSFVGPRPLLAEYLPRYTIRQRHRHDVRPGLTGRAQVSGRNSLSWDAKFEEDLKYVRRITFLGDMGILCRTALTVFQKDGISSGTNVTMESFTGTDASGAAHR